MSVWLSGIGVSRGIAIGRVQRMHGGDLEVPEYALADGDLDKEIARFNTAQRLAKAQLQQVRDQIPSGLPAEIAAFIETHLLMLDDRSMTEAVVALIRGKKVNAEAALREQRDALLRVFEQMDDPYLRTRRDDVDHVASRILRILLKGEKAAAAPRTVASAAPGASAGGDRVFSMTPATEPTVVVSDDLTPADIILMSQQHVIAFITEYGGPLSHTAILARSLGMPAIVGVHNARRLFREDEWLIVDGEAGHAVASPDEGALKFYRDKQERAAEARRALTKLKDKAAVSRDGVKITLLANIELPEDAQQAQAHGAEGVGLYRTEFLYMNRQGLPTEEEQYDAYSRVVSSVKGPITIRTLDLGADKQVDGGRIAGKTPNNPALGLRAIRLCLREPELFRTQARALMRASAHGNVHIMLPMISTLSEYLQAEALFKRARIDLTREGHKLAPDIPLGSMIEIPAAAIASAMLARHSKFFSIGTNDLIQYTLAIDRIDDEVNYLYDPLHPAVLQLIRMTIESGDKAGIPVAMCGEMAGDPRFTRLLLGLGLREFSMHPASVLEVKRQIIEADMGKLRAQVARILEGTDGLRLREEVEALTQL